MSLLVAPRDRNLEKQERYQAESEDDMYNYMSRQCVGETFTGEPLAHGGGHREKEDDECVAPHAVEEYETIPQSRVLCAAGLEHQYDIATRHTDEDDAGRKAQRGTNHGSAPHPRDDCSRLCWLGTIAPNNPSASSLMPAVRWSLMCVVAASVIWQERPTESAKAINTRPIESYSFPIMCWTISCSIDV